MLTLLLTMDSPIPWPFSHPQLHLIQVSSCNNSLMLCIHVELAWSKIECAQLRWGFHKPEQIIFEVSLIKIVRKDIDCKMNKEAIVVLYEHKDFNEIIAFEISESDPLLQLSSASCGIVKIRIGVESWMTKGLAS